MKKIWLFPVISPGWFYHGKTMEYPWLNQGNTHGYYHGFLNHQVGYNRSQQDFQIFKKFFFNKSYHGITMVKPSWLKLVKLPSQQYFYFQ